MGGEDGRTDGQAGGGFWLGHVVFIVCARCFGHHVFAPLSRYILDRVFCLAHLAKHFSVLAHLTKHLFFFFGSPLEAFFFGSLSEA